MTFEQNNLERLIVHFLISTTNLSPLKHLRVRAPIRVRQTVCHVLNTAVAGYWNYNIATIAYWKLCEEGWSEISARLLPIPISRDREQN